MFKRRFVKLDDIALHKDEEIRGSPKFNYKKSAHILNEDGSFDVNKKLDGKTKEEHLEGIEYIKKQLKKGNKILPPLVFDCGDGKYKKLDGFKRLKSYKELGYKNVEVIVCDTRGEQLGKMTCRGGGQHYTKYPKLLEGNEGVRPRDTVIARAKLLPMRLEMRENIHFHWGHKGIYRIVMGNKDFLELANAIIGVDL